MTKITVGKDLIDQAIEVLTDKCGGRCNAEYNPCHALEGATALRAALEQPPTQTVGNSGFDHKIAADFMSGREINDENVRKFVMASRWAHDDRTSLQALVATLCQDVAARDAEIALLKQSLLDAEALAEPAVGPDRYAWYQYMDHGNGMGWIERMVGHDPRTPDYAEMYHGVDWDDTKQVRNFRALYTAPPPPAEVPLLTDEEMMEMVTANAGYGGTNFDRVARAIEQAVRQKAGL